MTFCSVCHVLMMLCAGVSLAGTPIVRQAVPEDGPQPYPRILNRDLSVREFGPQKLESFRARFAGQDPPACRNDWCAGKWRRTLPPRPGSASPTNEETWLVRRPDTTVFDTDCKGTLSWDELGPAACSTDYPALFGPPPRQAPERLPPRILATPAIIAEARAVCEAVEPPTCGANATVANRADVPATITPWGAGSSRCDDLGCLVAFRGPTDSGGTPSAPPDLLLRATGPVCAAFVPGGGAATVAHVDLGPRDSVLDVYAKPHGFRVEAAACNKITGRSCATAVEATWGPDGRLHRSPTAGEIAPLAVVPKDTPSFDAFDAEYVIRGVRVWQGPADASARFRLAFAEGLYHIDAVVIDDLWYVHTGGKNVDAVDHLEVTNAIGDLYAILPNSDETATVERWQHRGETRRETFDSVLCHWTSLEPTEALHPYVPLWHLRATRIRCALPSDAPIAELRFADADYGKPESQVSRTIQFQVQDTWPPAYVPRRDYGCP